MTRPPSPDDEADVMDGKIQRQGEIISPEKVQVQKTKRSEEDSLKLTLSPVAGKNQRKNIENFKKRVAMITENGRVSLNDDDSESQNSDADDEVAAVTTNQSRTKNNEKVKTKTIRADVKSASKVPSSPAPGPNRTRKIEAALNQISNENNTEERGASLKKKSKASKGPMSRKNSHSDIQNYQNNDIQDNNVRCTLTFYLPLKMLGDTQLFPQYL